MTSERDDLLELFDAAWERFRERMDGLGDDEWRWEPVHDDDRVTLHWRFVHIVEFLCADRTRTWMGLPAEPVIDQPDPTNAQGALRRLDDAYAHWRDCLVETSGEALGQPVGPVAGPYADATRRAFVLHIVDELIHHTAEAALLRDLYAGRKIS